MRKLIRFASVHHMSFKLSIFLHVSTLSDVIHRLCMACVPTLAILFADSELLNTEAGLRRCDRVAALQEV